LVVRELLLPRESYRIPAVPNSALTMEATWCVGLFRDELKCVCVTIPSLVAHRFKHVTATVIRQPAVLSLFCWTFTPDRTENILIHLFRRLLKGCNNRVPLVEDIPLSLKYIKKLKHSHCRPGQAQRVLRKLRFPEFVTTAQSSGRLSALRTGHLYPQEMLLVLISVRCCVDPRAIVRSEGFYVDKKSTDTNWDRTSDLPICSTAS
jgi:hypothetical protein